MEPARRSITSSALTSLLPIAAASGVVRANYNTPKISFYSPSGNLIQPEGSSSPEFSGPTTGSPARNTSYYNELNTPMSHKTLPTTACLPPARPTLVPLTTLPMITMPLPTHLVHHHNYRHHGRSQTDSCKSIIELTAPVKGCGGVIRPQSSTLRSGVIQVPYKNSTFGAEHRSTASFIRDLRSDASFYKSRYIAIAAQSCGPLQKNQKTVRSKKPLHKRYLTGQGPASAQPQHHSTRAATTEQKGLAPDHKHQSGVLGPWAGHALRICFCQPYDGAGKATRTDAICTRQHASTMHGVHKKQGDLHIEDESVARPVTRLKDEKVSRRSVANKPHGSMRNDHGVIAGARV
jgi:hypothetical protein